MGGPFISDLVPRTGPGGYYGNALQAPSAGGYDMGCGCYSRRAGRGDKTVRLWDATTGMARGTLESHSGRVNSVVFLLDG
jgi:WD40 repeat protein